MTTLSLYYPPKLASTTRLATEILHGVAPAWAVSSDICNPRTNMPLSMRGSRSESDIFRLPNSNPAVRDWLYSRPDVDAIGEDAFENATTEGSTVFRVHPCSATNKYVQITPSVSNHWFMVPVQSINGVTVGLAYLDILFQRTSLTDDLVVPPLPVGKFALNDATGEVFITGFTESLMIVGWIKSILKCERVRELLMFAAPPANGMQPQILLRRNSFYERRDCRLCGVGHSMSALPPPCNGVGKGLSHDPCNPPPLTKIATLYRRFRGSYYGICVKTSYGERNITSSVIVPVLVDVRHGLHSTKQRFKQNLQRSIDFSLDCGTNGIFGLNPVSSSRLFILKSNQPITSSRLVSSDSSVCGKRRVVLDSNDHRPDSSSMHTSLSHESSQSERSNSPPGRARTRRRVGVDNMDRESVEFERRRRNRIAAEKSNRERKQRLQKEKEELARLKEYKKVLEARQKELIMENFSLKLESKAIVQGEPRDEMALDNLGLGFSLESPSTSNQMLL